MTDNLIERITHRIEADPRSGAALILYGLVRSAAVSGDRTMLALERLRQLGADERALVYELLEAYACGELGGQDWAAAVARLDRLIQGA